MMGCTSEITKREVAKLAREMESLGFAAFAGVDTIVRLKTEMR
jgi:hypothetical protein